MANTKTEDKISSLYLTLATPGTKWENETMKRENVFAEVARTIEPQTTTFSISKPEHMLPVSTRETYLVLGNLH